MPTEALCKGCFNDRCHCVKCKRTPAEISDCDCGWRKEYTDCSAYFGLDRRTSYIYEHEARVFNDDTRSILPFYPMWC